MSEAARRQSAPTEEQSMEVAEAARQEEWAAPSFVQNLFLGRLRMDLIDPYPGETDEDRAKTDAYLARIEPLLEKVDADKHDREGKLDPEIVDGLKALGAFGMKIPESYGGIGLSQAGYGRVMARVALADANLVALLSAHQSIGVPQPLKMFGTPEQKKKFLPRLAQGAISAFALTEPAVGSDPAAVATTATPSEDGEAYIINGEKLWCTNGTVAELFVVMARTAPKIKNGREIPQITAFIVDRDMPGVEIVHRCAFLGLKAIENGVIRFNNVRVPKENILLGEGKGLKLALETLNTGRLTIPSAAAEGSKEALRIARRWAADRVQWGRPVGEHDAVAQMLAGMAAESYAMEAMAELSAGLADRGRTDIRLEAAIAKLWTTEMGWRIVDDCLQIRGGRGYETADSLRARGEEPIPVERMLRDFRINRIFEGSSEIMRLFIAREAVDVHLKMAGDVVMPGKTLSQRLKGLVRSGLFYSRWIPATILRPKTLGRRYGKLAKHVRFLDSTARSLALSLFGAMVKNGPGLQNRQALLGRYVDIGAEMFAMASVIAKANSLRGTSQEQSAFKTAEAFCQRSRRRISDLFWAVSHNDDKKLYAYAREVLKGGHESIGL